jgi:transcriptional regulator with XRE-family HTH domain
MQKVPIVLRRRDLAFASHLEGGHIDAMFHLGSVIREMRRLKHLSIVELAARADVDKNTVSKLERRGSHFEQETLEKIAHALGMTAADLYAVESEQRGRIRTEIVGQLDDHKNDTLTSKEIYDARRRTSRQRPSPSSLETRAAVASSPSVAGDKAGVLMEGGVLPPIPDQELFGQLIGVWRLLRTSEERRKYIEIGRSLVGTPLALPKNVRR